MNLKKIGKVFTSKFVGTGPLSYKKRIYRAAVSQRLGNTILGNCALPDDGPVRHKTCSSLRIVKDYCNFNEVCALFVDTVNRHLLLSINNG